MNTFERTLYAKLLGNKALSEEVLRELAVESERTGKPFLRTIVDQKKLGEQDVLALAAGILQVPFVSLREMDIDEAAVKLVPVKFAWHYEFMPVRIEQDRLIVAVANPLPVRVQDEIRLSVGREIGVVLAPREHIIDMLKTSYGLGAETVAKIQLPGEKQSAAIDDIEKLAGEASVVRLVNQIILEAFKKRATDIHIEPYRERLRLRYRVDGVLLDQNVPPNFGQFLSPILSRLKIMASLDIVERRIPQDGRAMVKIQDQVLDLRLSFIPTPYGESVVMRILPTKMFFSLKKLGLAQESLTAFETLIQKPSGIIFITGPTGSGKTTTLYACLRAIDRNERKIITIEDPIEYEMEGVTQIQVNPEVGLTFAKGLRSMLRHDPDIIMVGEVRDLETAEIAVRVALTGHLVFSTLHTNDAATGVTRLIDIGIQPYLVASGVEAFIGQRLVRMICPQCKVEDTHVAEPIRSLISKSLSLGHAAEVKIYRGKGCDHCNNTGYYGRTSIHEIMIVDHRIKKLIIDHAPAQDIQRQAVQNGMKTLMQDGWLKVVKGVTTPEEVLHVCQDVQGTLQDAASAAVVEPVSGGERTAADIVSGYPDEKRIYIRVPKKIIIRFRLVEKGKGDIVEIAQRPDPREEESVFSRSLFDVSTGKKLDESIFHEVFTTTTNISSGGLAFESQFLIPIGSIIDLKVELPSDNTPVQCLAKVVRVEKDLPRCFYIAVCYLDLTGVDRGRIDDLMKREVARQRIVDLSK